MSRALTIVLSLTVAGLASLGGCAGTPGADDRLIAAGPDALAFQASVGGVEPVFERRCGSIDCHGQIGRAMRIYGAHGLRIPNDAGLTPSNGATSNDEVSSNYKSIIGVEPEQMDQVVREKGDPYSLLILKKPLLIETHKGGPALVRGDDAEVCISSWIMGVVNPSVTQKCINGAAPP